MRYTLATAHRRIDDTIERLKIALRRCNRRRLCAFVRRGNETRKAEGG